MAYTYRPPFLSPDEERDKLKPQPAATVPDPANDGDPFRRNTTAVEGNVETRYGGRVEPTRAAEPDAFERPPTPQLLVPSPAQAEVGPRTTSIPPLIPSTPVPPVAAAAGPQVSIGTTGPVTPPGGTPTVPVPVSPLAAGAAAAGAAAVNPVPSAVPPATATPFPGTLPGAIPQANAQPVAPRPLLEDENDPFRRRLIPQQ